MSIQVNVKDVPVQIPIELHDSCNCFSSCFNRRTKVYITKRMIAEKFDPSRSGDWETDRKASFQRIQWLFARYESEIMIEASIVYQDRGGFLTTKDIRRINAILSEASESNGSTTGLNEDSE